MKMSDLQNEPRWYRWLVYAIAGGFIGLSFWSGLADIFYGTVGG